MPILNRFKRLDVGVEIYDDRDDTLIAEYRTNIANEGERRVFAEQMANAYAAQQYSIVYPIRVIPR